MKKFLSEEMRTAYSVAGWRERYAMEHGDEIGDEFTTGAEV